MLVNKVGTFLVLVGILLLALFVYSDIVDVPVCGLLISGGFALALGVFLWFRSPPPPAKPTGRFRILRGGGKKDAKKK